MKMAEPEILPPAAKGLALIVDDIAEGREILAMLLKATGYQTITADDGNQAIRQFVEHKPDIVFMAVAMPVMDGYEAASRIKALAGSRFIPIIFLTSLEDERVLVKCIEAGGDDCLKKPFNADILNAKIKAMERISDLYKTVVDLYLEIESLNQSILNEQIVAEQIYSRAITGDNVTSRHIHSFMRAVSVFSGDMLLTAYHPDGGLRILLGDFTGHGLTAAVGMLPAAEVFRAMTAKKFATAEIFSAINAKLHRLLPTGIFMSACMLEIDKNMQSVTIWNAGMPHVIILGVIEAEGGKAQIKHRVFSQYLALGIVAETDQVPAPVTLSLSAGDRILLCSDGVTEAKNGRGEEFGSARYEAIVSSAEHSVLVLTHALDEFCAGQPFADDIILTEINCVPGLLEVKKS